jgi:predicted dehydrogenase
MKIGIIGSGLQALRRIEAIKRDKDAQIVIAAASSLDKAKAFAKQFGIEKTTGDWKEVVRSAQVDAVLVCTPTYLHYPMTIAVIEGGKHVLCEKPLALDSKEALAMVEHARKRKVVLKCGFNHRHHPAVLQAKKWFDEGRIGELMHVRGIYGHTGRQGYESEWRGDPKLVGKSHALMELGVHLIDLARWFGGEIGSAYGALSTSYWPIAPLDDNAFVLLQTRKGKPISLHSSITEWKNLFSFEVFGTDGYLKVNGVGGSYGVETLAALKRDFTRPFEESRTEYRRPDQSWELEWKEFLHAVRTGKEPLGSGTDGLQAMRCIEAIVESSKTGKAVSL